MLSDSCFVLSKALRTDDSPNAVFEALVDFKVELSNYSAPPFRYPSEVIEALGSAVDAVRSGALSPKAMAAMADTVREHLDNPIPPPLAELLEDLRNWHR